MKRRSIAEFEKWLRSEIETAKKEQRDLELQQEDNIRRQMLQDAKIDTLQAVYDKLTAGSSADQERVSPKDEVAGSSPARPTIDAPTEGYAMSAPFGRGNGEQG